MSFFRVKNRYELLESRSIIIDENHLELDEIYNRYFDREVILSYIRDTFFQKPKILSLIDELKNDLQNVYITSITGPTRICFTSTDKVIVTSSENYDHIKKSALIISGGICNRVMHKYTSDRVLVRFIPGLVDLYYEMIRNVNTRPYLVEEYQQDIKRILLYLLLSTIILDVNKRLFNDLSIYCNISFSSPVDLDQFLEKMKNNNSIKEIFEQLCKISSSSSSLILPKLIGLYSSDVVIGMENIRHILYCIASAVKLNIVFNPLYQIILRLWKSTESTNLKNMVKGLISEINLA